MGWLDDIRKKKEVKLPPELEGKSDDDVIASLKENADLKARLATAEAARVEDQKKVETITTEFESIKAKLAAADAARNSPSEKDENKELPNFVEDPDNAFNQRAAPIATVAVNSAVMTSRMLALQELDNQDMASPQDAKTMDGRLFRAWQAEIEGIARRYPPVQMATPAAWLNVYFYVKGLHSDELSNPEIRKKKFNFLEPATQGTVPPNQQAQDKDTLTDEEKRIAGRMGVSPENYLKRKKAMQMSAA